MKTRSRLAINLGLLAASASLAVAWACPLYPNPCSGCSSYVVMSTGILLCKNIYLGEEQEYYGCCQYKQQWLQCINATPPGYFAQRSDCRSGTNSCFNTQMTSTAGAMET